MSGLSARGSDKVVGEVSLVNDEKASLSLSAVFEQKNRRLVCQSDSGKNSLSDDLMVGTQRSELRPLKLAQH